MDHPPPRGQGGDDQHRGDEMAGDAVGQPCDLRPRGAAATDQAVDGGHHGLLLGPRDLEFHRLVEVGRPGDHQVARSAAYRAALPGEHRFVELDRAIAQQGRVGRHHLAGAQQQPVAGGEFHYRHLRPVTVAPGARPSRDDPHQPVHGVGGAQPAADLDHPGNQDEGDEHRDRVEVHLPGLLQGGEHAAGPGHGQPQRDGYVHAQSGVAQVPPGAGEKVAPGVDQHDGGHDQGRVAADDLPEGQRAVGAGAAHPVAGDREGHDRHGQDQGEQQPLGVAMALFGEQGVAARGVEGMGVVADRLDGGEDLGERHRRRVVADPGLLAVVVDLDVANPVEPAQLLLVEPQAGGAADFLEDQRYLGEIAVPGEEIPLQRLVVENPQAIDQGLGRLAGRTVGRRVPVGVVVLQPGGDDAARHRLATRAAEGPLGVQDRRAMSFSRGYGEVTVEASLGHGSGRIRRVDHGREDALGFHSSVRFMSRRK